MPETTINPTVGRVVWFYPTTGGAESGFARAPAGKPLAAVIAHVHSPKMVNLAVFDANGVSRSFTSVDLFQAADALPSTGRYCTWMPFQKGQAAKTEELQAQVKTAAADAYIPRTHRQDLEVSVVHAVATAAAARGADGASIGKEVRVALDALLGGAQAGPAPLPVVETKAYADGTVATGTAPLPNTSPVTEKELAAAAVAPRVTEAELEAEITGEHYFTAADGVAGEASLRCRHVVVGDTQPPGALGLLTFCVLTLKNGFTVTGESACASAANFDPDVGRRLARKHAVGKVWPLLGFRLRDKLSGHA